MWCSFAWVAKNTNIQYAGNSMNSDNSIAWDYVPLFRPADVALAVVGEPKTDDPAALLRAAPVLERLRDDYEATRRWYASAPDDGKQPAITLVHSAAMREAQTRVAPELKAIGAQALRFWAWLRTPMADFERQVFERQELAAWVAATGGQSAYQFDKPTAATAPIEYRTGEARWSPIAKAMALEIIERDRQFERFPNHMEIAYEIEEKFAKLGLIGIEGKPITAAYIKRHALRGIDSRKQ
jgi:hypothetical protein